MPFVEGKRIATWTTWNEFVEALKTQFGDTDIENKARSKLETIRQGKQSVTDHCNQFRLISTETNCNDQTLQRLLLKSFNKNLQDAWAQVDQDMGSTENLANWAIRKESKLTFVQTMQHPYSTNRNQDIQINRNTNGTFRSNSPAAQDNEDPMDLDVATRKGYLNLSKQEYERRRREKRCFKCGIKGHSIGQCRKNQQKGPGQPKIRELETEPEQKEETLNEESPQE